MHKNECKNVTNNVATHLTRLMRRNRTKRKKEKQKRVDKEFKEIESILSKVVFKDGQIWNPYQNEWVKCNK